MNIGEKKEMICINCPIGCTVTAEKTADGEHLSERRKICDSGAHTSDENAHNDCKSRKQRRRLSSRKNERTYFERKAL